MSYTKIIEGNYYYNTADDCVIKITSIDYRANYFKLVQGYITIPEQRFMQGSVFHKELIPYINFEEELEKL